MRKLFLPFCLVLLSGCCSTPNDPLEDIPLVGPLIVKPMKQLMCPAEPVPEARSSSAEQKIIAETAGNIATDQKDILKANTVIKKKLPNDAEPKIIDARANNSLGELKRLNDANTKLKVTNETNVQLIADKDARIKELEDEKAAGLQAMYGWVILIGIIGVGVGIGIVVLSQGSAMKLGLGVAAGSITIAVVALTFDEYGCYIAYVGAALVIGAMIWGAFIVRKKYKEKDSEQKKGHHTERQLVRDMQMILEYLPDDTRKYVMDHMSRERGDEHKNRIKELKKMDSLGEPTAKTFTIPLKETDDVSTS